MIIELPDQAHSARDYFDHLQATLFRRACGQLNANSDLKQALLLISECITISQFGAEPELASAVAERIRPNWDLAASKVQIQYVHFADYTDPHVLYLKPLQRRLIVLVAQSDVLPSRLRRIADALVDILSISEDSPAIAKKFTTKSLVKSNGANHGTYAIAWRSVERMPRSIRDIVQESAQRLARLRGCELYFLGVASDHVHLVLQCPPGRSGSWAAHVFKRGIEDDIGHRFGTPVALWRKGFLADSSNQPIAGEALLAYLNS